MARINYVELAAGDLAEATRFYGDAFGFEFTGFGPSYAATTTGIVDLGLQGDLVEAPAAPLAVIEVPDVQTAQAAVEQAGGVVTRAIFAFPGGRRFHFRDPAGNELAAVTSD